MSANKFLTTRTTSLAGLAAAAYSNSAFFFFVQDQIRGAHSMYDLHRSRPSSLFLDMIGFKEVFVDYFNNIIETDPLYLEVSRLFPHKVASLSDFSEVYLEVFLRELDNLTNYSIFIKQFMSDCLDIMLSEISFRSYETDNYAVVTNFLAGLRGQNTDIKFFEDILAIVLDNPSTKIHDAPPDRILKLKRGFTTDYNHKGLTKARVEIPIRQWEESYIYRDLKQLEPATAKMLITENYDGYMVEAILEPTLTNGLGTEIIGATYNYSGNETLMPNSRRLTAAEQRIIDFDLVNSPTGLVEV